jgi:hypothetical protein
MGSFILKLNHYRQTQNFVGRVTLLEMHFHDSKKRGYRKKQFLSEIGVEGSCILIFTRKARASENQFLRIIFFSFGINKLIF